MLTYLQTTETLIRRGFLSRQVHQGYKITDIDRYCFPVTRLQWGKEMTCRGQCKILKRLEKSHLLV